jgi:hypothetical protein
MNMRYCEYVIAEMETQLERVKRWQTLPRHQTELTPEKLWEQILRGMAAIQNEIAVRLSDALQDNTPE